MLPDGSSGIDIQQISITPDAGVFIGGNYTLSTAPAFNRFSNPGDRAMAITSVFFNPCTIKSVRIWVAEGAGGIILFKDMSLHVFYHF